MPEEFPSEEAPKPKKGLFGGKKPELDTGPSVSELTEKVNSIAARLRISEERYSELRKKLLLMEQNMLVHHRKTMADVKTINSELSELKHMINVVEDRIITIIKELQLTARREDIGVMKRYIELWDPTRFVTRDNVEKIIKEIIAGDAEESDEEEETD